MSAKTKTYSYIVWLRDHRAGELVRTGLSDMLRYDNAVIVEELPNNAVRVSGTHYPTVERWRSFGILVSDVTEVR